MAATLSVNGKPQRKQLSDQLDRMDGIIDCLADALPDAVADACRDGARQAVKDAVIEILTNPELRSLIGGLAAPVTPKPVSTKPSLWSRMRTKISDLRTAIAKRLTTVKKAITSRCQHATMVVVIAAHLMSAMLPMKILLIGTGIGLVVGMIGYACPHSVSAMIGGVSTALTVIVTKAGGRLQRATHPIGFVVPS